ncbi:MAG: ClpX C4-type zinc finger protein [Rhodospirillales bacterium]|nr:ClpX C4-type zinc finger protein [Rhodospirillales bacterium]MDH3970493.1 ClpX C4-type zinc finger protein [Rhodospirillales bacterium]
MPSLPSSLEEVYASWDSAVRQKDFKRGLLVASDGYRLATKKKSHADEKILLYFIKMAVQELLKGTSNQAGVEEGEDVCSFCCRSTEGKKAVGGPNVLICDECIRTAFELTLDQGS